MGGECGSYNFVIPCLPPSANALHQIIYSQRKVVLKPEVMKWRSDAKLFVPRMELQPESLIEVATVFHYRHHHANGKLRRFDTHNMLKVLLDVIAEKVGFDDCRIKSGSWASVNSPDEKVEVRLREVSRYG